MNLERIELLETALYLTKKKKTEHPEHFILDSVIAQLKYLLDLETKKTSDFSKLENITIGRIVSYDLANYDEELVEILCKVFTEIRLMRGDKF